MKKILSLVMALAMVLGCFAMAETTSILDADMDELLVLDRESSLNDWEGEWVLVAAYITADFAEEYDVEQSGLLAVPENAATLTITALKDATANDKELGTMVDVASYIHDHTYDLSGELTTRSRARGTIGRTTSSRRWTMTPKRPTTAAPPRPTSRATTTPFVSRT